MMGSPDTDIVDSLFYVCQCCFSSYIKETVQAFKVPIITLPVDISDFKFVILL